MAKGKSIYFTKKELENLNEFFNKWNDKLSPEDEDFYAFWLQKTGTAFGKIADVIEKLN